MKYLYIGLFAFNFGMFCYEANFTKDIPSMITFEFVSICMLIILVENRILKYIKNK